MEEANACGVCGGMQLPAAVMSMWGVSEAPQLPSPPFLSSPTRASIGPTQPEVS